MTRTAVSSVVALLAILAFTPPATLAQTRVDALGDSLPDEAIARVGTTRMRHFSLPDKLCFGLGCIAWSPDGKVIATTMFASGRVGVQARLWEASTGKPLCLLENNERYGPSFVCFSPDGQSLAAAAGNRIVLWDVATGKEKGQFLGHRAEVDSLAFQDAGKKIVSVDADGTVHWWDVPGYKEIRIWQTLANEPKVNDRGDPFEMRIFNACFSKDGKSLAVEKWWTADKGIRRSSHTMALVFDLDTRKELWREDTRGFGCSFAFAPDGKKLAMAGNDRQLSLMDTSTGRRLVAGPKLGLMPYGLAVTPDGKSVAIHWFAGIAFWSLDEKTSLREMRLNGASTDPTFSPDGKRLAVSTHMSYRILDVATLKPAVYWPSNDVGWTKLAFSADGRTLLRANGLNLVSIDTMSWTTKWEVEDPPRKIKANLPKPVNLPDADKILDFWMEDPNFRAANADHSFCVVKGDKHPNVLLNMKTEKVLAHLETPHLRLERCSGFFSPHSTVYVMRDWDSQFRDGKIREINTIFAIPSGQRLCQLPTENGTLHWSFSADESRVAFFERHSGIIHVYNTATGKLIRQIGEADPNWKWIYATLALSPDGNMLAVWTEDLQGKVQIWDLRTGKHHRWLAREQTDKGHVAACLAWSPDSRILAVGGLDNSVRLWEVATARVRREFRGHLCQARLLAFSPDGELLASGSDDTTLLIWKTFPEKKRRDE